MRYLKIFGNYELLNKDNFSDRSCNALCAVLSGNLAADKERTRQENIQLSVCLRQNL